MLLAVPQGVGYVYFCPMDHQVQFANDETLRDRMPGPVCVFGDLFQSQMNLWQE